VRVSTLTWGICEPDFPLAWVGRDSGGGILKAELANDRGVAQFIPGLSFGGINTVRRRELGLHGALELLCLPQPQRLVDHRAAIEFRMGRHMGIHGGK
jgi:hypothetical protein